MAENQVYCPKEIKVAKKLGLGNNRGGEALSLRHEVKQRKPASNMVDVTQPKWPKNEDGPRPGEKLQALSPNASTWMCMSFSDICILHAPKYTMHTSLP